MKAGYEELGRRSQLRMETAARVHTRLLSLLSEMKNAGIAENFGKDICEETAYWFWVGLLIIRVEAETGKPCYKIFFGDESLSTDSPAEVVDRMIELGALRA